MAIKQTVFLPVERIYNSGTKGEVEVMLLAYKRKPLQ